MKKVSIFLLCVIVLLPIGCAVDKADTSHDTADEEPFYVVDLDISMGNVYDRQTFAETDDSLYCLDDGIVYVSDKAYKSFMPLCARPDCRHNSPDCNAYIGSGSMLLYGSWFYYLPVEELPAGEAVEAELWRMRLDGTEHEKVCVLPMPDVDRSVYRILLYAAISGKHIVYRTHCVKIELETGDATTYESHMYSLDLESMEVTELIKGLTAEESFLSANLLAGRGDKLYAQIKPLESDPPYRIAEIDLTDGSYRILWNGSHELRLYNRGVCLSGDTLQIIDVDYETNTKTLYKIDINTCEIAVCGTGIAGQSVWDTIDGASGYFYAALGPTLDDPGQRGVYICDMDMNVIDFVPASDKPKGAKGQLIIGYITEDYIFGLEPVGNYGGIYSYAYFNGVPRWYLEKADIGTGNLMWRRWEP